MGEVVSIEGGDILEKAREARKELDAKSAVDRLEVRGFKSLKTAIEEGEPQPPQVIVPRLAWRGRTTLLAAREKAGKSTLLGAAAAAVTQGTEWLGEETYCGPVLWVGVEEHQDDLVRRFKAWDADPEKILFSTYLEGAEKMSLVTEAASLIRPVLVVLDTLPTWCSGLVKNQNDAAMMAPVMALWQNLAQLFDTAVVLLHHGSKGTGDYRGSTAIGAGVDAVLEMTEDHAIPEIRHIRGKGRVAIKNYSIRLMGNDPFLFYEMYEPYKVEVGE